MTEEQIATMVEGLSGCHHAIGMGGSYMALITGFYVDNGPFLPLWSRLPHITYWLLPSIVGGPLIWTALRRFGREPAEDR